VAFLFIHLSYHPKDSIIYLVGFGSEQPYL